MLTVAFPGWQTTPVGKTQWVLNTCGCHLSEQRDYLENLLREGGKPAFLLWIRPARDRQVRMEAEPLSWAFEPQYVRACCEYVHSKLVEKGLADPPIVN
jgi:hypothetical protein